MKRMHQKKKNKVGFFLDKGIVEKLEESARKEERTRSAIVTRALREYFERRRELVAAAE